jgi:hypothetical protein
MVHGTFFCSFLFCSSLFYIITPPTMLLHFSPTVHPTPYSRSSALRSNYLTPILARPAGGLGFIFRECTRKYSCFLLGKMNNTHTTMSCFSISFPGGTIHSTRSYEEISFFWNHVVRYKSTHFYSKNTTPVVFSRQHMHTETHLFLLAPVPCKLTPSCSP